MLPPLLVEGILLAQIALLVLLHKALCQIQGQLAAKLETTVAATTMPNPTAPHVVAARIVDGGAPTTSARLRSGTIEGVQPPIVRTNLEEAPAIAHKLPPAASRPTVATLLPEVVKPGWSAAEECLPFCDEEMEIVRKLYQWLGGERVHQTPRDLLACFVRGYAYRADWAEASCAFLDRALTWRAQCGADQMCMQEPPPRRSLFESLVRSAPIGFDKEGHPLILERFGAVEPAKLLSSFDEASFLRHQTYSREASRLYAAANSARRRKRLYKSVAVVDMRGLSMSHVNRQMLKLMQNMYALFGWHYPESIHKFYVINAPWIFRTLWAGVKVWMHPITVRKFDILGSDYMDDFAKAGVQLTGGVIPEQLSGWWEQVRELQQAHDLSQLNHCGGFIPEADECELARLATALT
uniref:CRAL-TRIO domain-containing protein n=1 Tax=Calcidiscus leptoporus TaxID=127549 RepID=A0A7S0JEH8_9EUKA|mmetsp:Transcript_52072/g.119806  ORF Transcript_52072/g.119806 Transcript_52072/m.119806 type:complete len:410 (+) Transcript_52072:72-1301(+)|eukprot:CAMPEP_0119361018 /NCGR_PEP_ID=MMETSP1334-20130426/8448_1 /TAXON_ID=127549 /ORGANISM="Calcidiscus leptoporus, Strain RCC1130" /LENGTH=409 /DNA_ID=CAMNT_0007375945 /DNA_START=66 /DNA_END=1295 /DNA_ORIENTATION=+